MAFQYLDVTKFRILILPGGTFNLLVQNRKMVKSIAKVRFEPRPACPERRRHSPTPWWLRIVPPCTFISTPKYNRQKQHEIGQKPICSASLRSNFFTISSIFYAFSFEDIFSLAEGGANILPVSISGSGQAGKLEVSFLKFLSKITLNFQFYFLSRTDRLKDSNSHVAEFTDKSVIMNGGKTFDCIREFVHIQNSGQIENLVDCHANYCIFRCENVKSGHIIHSLWSRVQRLEENSENFGVRG